MEVILLKDVEKLGKKGDVVHVRDGFGRNFLLPRTYAIRATEQNRALIENVKKRSAKRRVREKEEAEKLAQTLRSLPLRLEVRTGENDKLFGSVTAQDVADLIQQHGITIDKKQIRLSEPIRSLGTHSVPVELDTEAKLTLQVEVVRKRTSPERSGPPR